jgi:hypothetical protein
VSDLPQNINVIRIFIASPGGLGEERKAARDVVDEINRAHSDHWGCQIKLVGWEDTIPGYQRPQSLINQDLDQCEYFVGLLWDHWGSKPATNGSRYTSGFEEEYCRAQDHLDAGRMKDLVLFFKAIDPARLADPGKSLQSVLAFKKTCVEERKLLYKEFATISEFRDALRAKFSAIGWNETEIQLSRHLNGAADEQRPVTKSTDLGDPHESRLIEHDAIEFISGLSQRSSEWGER